jgi:uncharacterized protein (DUF1697 family)
MQRNLLLKTTWHIALLRGINVGRAKRVAMADLRALVSDLGYGEVRSLLNSGNVIFTTTAATGVKAAARIEEALASKLEVASRVTVVTAAELGGIVADNPLLSVANDHSRLLVAVLSDPKDQAKLVPLLELDWDPDSLAVSSRAAYMWCAGGILESRLAQAVGRALGSAATTRNWATILKLHELTRSKT